jgi:hypothetical protein
MTKDETHLHLLGIFHYVLAGFMVGYGFFSILLFGVIMPVVIPALERQQAREPPLEWMFASVAALLLVIGWVQAVLLFVAGRKLRKHRAHTFCLIVAVLECWIVPFGTVLGVLTILVLSRRSVINLFDAGKR